MTFNQYTANHKTWDHVGNITPNVEYSESVRPHGEFKPADWLPVGRYDKYNEEYFVVSAGKIVAFDRQGRVVPAGLKSQFATTSGDVLTYTATDVTEKVVDLSTGAVVAAAGGYTRAELTAALLDRGLLDDGENAEDFISFPVGIAPYNFYSWAGGDGNNPANLKKHNFMLQHRVAILCDYTIEVPLVPAAATQLDLSAVNAIENTDIDDWSETGGRWKSSTGLSLTQRYASDVSSGDNVVALILPNLRVAKSTTLTTVTFSSSTDFARERSSVTQLTQAGDYFIDYDVGVILMFETDGNAAAVSSGTIDYYHYDNSPTSVGTYGCAVGDLRPGDFVKADANSNFVKATTFASGDYTLSATPQNAEVAALMNACNDRNDEIIGQVLELEVHPKDLLERVRTAYKSLGTVDQMPGSASNGLPAAVTYAGASNTMVRIQLLR